ncbi:phenylalanine--tRNA ligase subunit alpha, partial [Chryseobacterium sp. SIMBA_028]
EEIESFRIKYNGKKGVLNDFYETLKDVPNDQKKEFGQKINSLKQAVAVKLEDFKNTSESSLITEKEDLTRPAFPLDLGSRHPINLV